jgi:2-phospho-L-lactate/phosphoenolpyruvate guanylyltransferase
MSTWTVIPVKQLVDSKRRLAHLVSPIERAELITYFLDNLLDVLASVSAVNHILVVTADAAVAALARKRKTGVLIEATPSDLNEAVSQGVAMAIAESATAVLILPVDLPFVQVEDVETILASGSSTTGSLMAICGDESETGTNALYLAPPANFTFHYGPGSFQAHLEEGRVRGRSIQVVRTPGLRFDLDDEKDWLIYNGRLDSITSVR